MHWPMGSSYMPNSCEQHTPPEIEREKSYRERRVVVEGSIESVSCGEVDSDLEQVVLQDNKPAVPVSISRRAVE